LDFSKEKMDSDQGEKNNADEEEILHPSVTSAVAAAIAAAVANSRRARLFGGNGGGGEDSFPSPPRVQRVKPAALSPLLPSSPLTGSQHESSSSSLSSSSSPSSVVRHTKRAKRQGGGDVADVIDDDRNNNNDDDVGGGLSATPSSSSSSTQLLSSSATSLGTPSKRTFLPSTSYTDRIAPGWQEEEADQDSDVDDRLASARAWRLTPPPPSFCLADASMMRFWTENLNKFSHIYAFDPAFPGKDLLPPGADGPVDDGIDVLGGIARGLNSSSSWKVFISFQPPRVWQRKGLRNAKCVQRVTNMAMRVSYEQKTCFVYLKDESCGDVIQVTEDSVWRS